MRIKPFSFYIFMNIIHSFIKSKSGESKNYINTWYKIKNEITNWKAREKQKYTTNEFEYIHINNFKKNAFFSNKLNKITLNE